VQEKCLANDMVYFNKKTLVESIEGRPMHQITLASQNAFLEKKPVVFLTCRVHCGETPAQYMLQGILDKLTDFDDVQTRTLLDNYVFKIIPLLNPDGVARGNWRFDIKGQNLNRKYNSDDYEKYPTILAAKDAILEEENLKMFMDFHAHTTKRGCFIYGNTLECIDQQAECKLLPKLMSLNSVNFDFRSSCFQDDINNV
jgi:murein tripeptide amidase MpaA